MTRAGSAVAAIMLWAGGTAFAETAAVPQVHESTTQTGGLAGADLPAMATIPPPPRPLSGADMAVSAAPVSSVPRKNGLCGDPKLQGDVLAPIKAKFDACDIAAPVRVRWVDGVALSQPVVVDCDTAQALRRWVQEGIKPTVGRLGGGLRSLEIAGSYTCRTRNNQPRAKVSEHARGRAIDVSGVTLKDGTAFTVLDGWRDPAQASVLRWMHRSACGPFGTVLGPNADQHHADHIHVDITVRRSGPYCQ